MTQPSSTQVTPRDSRLPRPVTCHCPSGTPMPVLMAPHIPHLLAPGPEHHRLLVPGPCSRDLALALGKARAGDAAGQPLPEAELSACSVAAWPRLRAGGSSGGLGRAARRGEGSGAGGWAGRGGSPGPSALLVAQLEPRFVRQASIHLHSRVHWLIHSVRTLSTLPPPCIQHAPRVCVWRRRGTQCRGGPHLCALPHLAGEDGSTSGCHRGERMPVPPPGKLRTRWSS